MIHFNDSEVDITEVLMFLGFKFDHMKDEYFLKSSSSAFYVCFLTCIFMKILFKVTLALLKCLNIQ